MINPFDINNTEYDLNKKITELTIVIFLMINNNKNINLSENLIKDTIYKSIEKLYFDEGITEKTLNSSDIVRKIKTNDFPTFSTYISLLKNDIENIDIKENIYYKYILDRLQKLKNDKFLDIFDGKTDLN